MKSLIIVWFAFTSPIITFAETGLDVFGKDGAALDESEKWCINPHAAITTTLKSQARRAECMEKASATEAELLLAADRLSSILSTHKAVIDLKRVPSDPDYKDPKSKISRYRLSSNLPTIYLTKDGDRWVFADDVVDSINQIYKDSLHFSVTWFYHFFPSWATKDIFGIPDINLVQITLFLVALTLALLLRFGITFIVVWKLGRLEQEYGLSDRSSKLKNSAHALANVVVAGALWIVLPSLDLNATATHYLMVIVRLLAALFVVSLAYHSVDILCDLLQQRALRIKGKLNTQLIPLIDKAFKVIVCIIGAFLILRSVDVDITGLLAGVTIGGLAFSFAAKDTVANLFGSVTIFTDRAFVVGDWIKIIDVEGIVMEVGFRSTRIRTFSDTVVTMPNSKFTDSMVENFSDRKKRKARIELHIAFDTAPDQIEAFATGIRAIIKAHPKTRKDSYEVNFIGYGDGALKILISFISDVKTWTEELRVRHEINLDIWRLAGKMNMKFASAAPDVHIYTQGAKEDAHKPSEAMLKKTITYFAPNGEGVVPPGPRMGEAYLAEGKPSVAGRYDK